MKEYQPTSDPLFYVLCAVFAGITTLWPSVSGQHWLLIGMQGLGLASFTILASRYGPPGRHLSVFALWCVAQYLTLLLTASWNPAGVERTLPSGFEYHRQWLEAYHTTDPSTPWRAMPAWREWLRVAWGSAGSMATGGVSGSFVFARGLNYLAFGTAVFLSDIPRGSELNVVRYVTGILPPANWFLYTGMTCVHLAVAPWWWRPRNASEDSRWRWGRPLLLLGCALIAAGIVIGGLF